MFDSLELFFIARRSGNLTIQSPIRDPIISSKPFPTLSLEYRLFHPTVPTLFLPDPSVAKVAGSSLLDVVQEVNLA